MSDEGMFKNDRVKILTLALVTLGLYAPVLRGLLGDWWVDSNYSHGFLIPVISGYLVWERRERLAQQTLKPSNLGLAVTLLAIVVLMAGNLGSELFLQRISLLVLLTGVILYVAGFAHWRALLFPLGILILMIPLPAIILYQVTFPLQLLASRVATYVIRWAQIPVLREGNVIHLTHTSLEVVEACSGIRSLFTLITIGLFAAYFTQTRLSVRLLIVASTVPIAILANAARLAGTAILAQYFGEQFAKGFFHTFSGWIIVLLACVLLFVEIAIMDWIARWFRPKDPAADGREKARKKNEVEA